MCQLYFKIDEIIDIVDKPLDLKNPLLVDFERQEPGFYALLIKEMSRKLDSNLLILNPDKFVEGMIYSNQPIVLVIDSEANLDKCHQIIDKNNLGVLAPVLMMVPNMTFLKSSDNARLNQKVYYLDLEAMWLYEKYSVNGIAVENLIGRYVVKGGSSLIQQNPGLDFIPSNRNREKRNNYYGLHLIAMTEHEPPYTSISKKCSFKDCLTITLPFNIRSGL